MRQICINNVKNYNKSVNGEKKKQDVEVYKERLQQPQKSTSLKPNDMKLGTPAAKQLPAQMSTTVDTNTTILKNANTVLDAFNYDNDNDHDLLDVTSLL